MWVDSPLASAAASSDGPGMFTAKWKKEANHLLKGARKFLHYKRDLLKTERIEEIESRRSDLAAAIKSGDLKRVDEASKQLRLACENSLREKPTGWFEENVEVMFVAIVIALGLRAYYLQPFRIPTGSMQPTLNGITGEPLPRAEWPSAPVRLAEYFLRGRKYIRVVNDEDRTIAFVGPNGEFTQDFQSMHFFSRSLLMAHDARPLRLPAPGVPMMQAGLGAVVNEARSNGNRIPKGTVLAEGRIDTGDLVLVNKFSYHFRRPERGEVFVFDTRGIEGIHARGGEQGGGSHYIKRLCGVPGDTLSIQPPNLIINGKIATEPGIRRVIDGQGPYAINAGGYVLVHPQQYRRDAHLRHYLVEPTDELVLRSDDVPPGMREYAALGDNTGNSLDSRYWGAVHEFNLVGPAAFSLWPITTGHWGFIR